MNSYRLAGALVLLGAAAVTADDRAGSMTVLPPPPTIMDWHAGNRQWNLEGAQHIHFPMPSQHDGGHSRHFGGHHGFRGHRRGFGAIGPLYYGSYYVAPGYGYSYPYGYSYSYYYNGIGYPYYANGLDYLTQMGVSAQSLAATLNAHRRGYAATASAPAREPAIRPSHPQAQARARRLIQEGDRRFRDKQYARAYDVYRSARRAAPDLAEVHFRIAQTLTALGRYTSAVTAIERGLRVDPTWPDSDFDLSDLYGDDPLPLLSHKERLAMALRDDMDNPDLLFLLGYQLFFTGDRARARPFFERAVQLTGDPSHLLPFLHVPVEELPNDRAVRLAEPDDADQGPAPPADERIPRNGTRREI
jgi:tetratricopeptide (TPR) repeat protein